MKLRKSLSTKIILLVEAILLFSSAVFCGISISRAQIGIRQAIRQRMVDIANCAAGSVNGDILKALKAGDEYTPEYRIVYDSMAVFRDNAELEYIYAIRDEGNGRFTFVVDTDPDEPARFGDEVMYTEALNRASQGTTSVDEVPYSDQWGDFYSAYSPVFDSSGKVAGIVAADFSVAWFDAQMQEQTLSNVRSYAVILGVTILAAAALCLAVVRPYVRQQEQLLEEKVTAESANQAKSEFLANMSHEIRTPINAVLGMNEMILRESRQGRELPAGQTEEVRETFDQIGFYAREAESAGRSLLTLINDILDFSRIEAGRMELVGGPYQLSAVLNDVSSTCGFRAREKGLEFIFDTDPSLPDQLFGDEVRVREILMNLLTNAVKYTERGFVRFTVRGGERSGSAIALKFIVEDSGVGIRREDMGKLFSKFQRLDLQRNSTVEGSGLGLVITKSLLDMMDGTISVESEYGRGSVFTVILPQRIVTDASAGDPQVRMSGGLKGTEYRTAFRAPEARILIVDDTKINLTVTAGLLKNTGIRTDTAAGGAEAVALAERNAYDLILMDQRMPVMDGTETLRRIRQLADNHNSGIPVICLTADAIVGAKERYLAEGFTDYLSKPVDGRQLEAMLMRHLPAEKVIPAAAETDTPKEEPSVPPVNRDDYAPLRASGIDPESALRYCQGNGELYRTLLNDFAREYPEKADVLRRAVASGDWKNYCVFVHALKSSSRLLGVRDLSEAAARLEAASSDGDIDTVRREHEPMMARYEAVSRTIRGYLEVPEAEEDPEVLEFIPDDAGL